MCLRTLHMFACAASTQGGDPAQFKRILTAYEVLSDAKKVRYILNQNNVRFVHHLFSALQGALPASILPR